MAIDPSAEYPGQIVTGDPGYPLGKPRNVTVPGDGTGTPLEQEWLSDLFGWQQALLDAGGITPSGVPDEVGASDYMDALDALYPAIGRMTTAESDITALEADVAALEASRVTGPASATATAFTRFDGTTGKLVKDGVVLGSDAGAVSGVTDLTLSGEALYSSPKTRTLFLALETGFSRSSTSVATQWQPGTSLSDIPYFTCLANSLHFYVPVPQLPLGAVVNRVRFGLQPGVARTGADRMTMQLRKSSANTTTGDATSAQVGSSVTDDGTANVQLREMDLSGTPYTVVSGDRLHVVVAAGNTAGANPDFLIWIEVRYTDPGPRSPGG
jgi:hypothetical protein